MSSKFLRPAVIGAAIALLALAPRAHALQFRMLGWSSHDLNLRFDAHGKPVETAVSTGTLSTVYEFNDAGPLILYKQVAHDDGPMKQTACVVPVPPELKKGILLLIPGDDSQIPLRKVLPDSQGFVSENAPLVYTHLWLDDTLETRPVGTIGFHNLSKRRIALQLEQQRHLLAPGETMQAPLIPGSKRMDFRAAVEIDGQWTIFARNPLPTRGPERMLIILRDVPATAGIEPPSRETRIQMVALYDWPAPPANRTALASVR